MQGLVQKAEEDEEALQQSLPVGGHAQRLGDHEVPTPQADLSVTDPELGPEARLLQHAMDAKLRPPCTWSNLMVLSVSVPHRKDWRSKAVSSQIESNVR